MTTKEIFVLVGIVCLSGIFSATLAWASGVPRKKQQRLMWGAALISTLMFSQECEPQSFNAGGLVTAASAVQNIVQGTVSFTDTASHQLIEAPGVSNWFLYITEIGCYSVSASGTFSLETFQNGSGGSTIYYGTVSGVGGGFNITFPTPIGGHSMTANTGFYVQGTTALTTVYCNASGYRGP